MKNILLLLITSATAQNVSNTTKSESLGSVVGNLTTGLGKTTSNLTSGVGSGVSNLTSGVGQTVNATVPGKVGSIVGNLTSSIGQAVSNATQGVAQAVNNTTSTIGTLTSSIINNNETNAIAQAALRTATDALLFVNPMAAFQLARNSKTPSDLDWTSDGCTTLPDNPFGIKFNASCQRQDFGYRNYQNQLRFNVANKARIDTNFRKDMYTECANLLYVRDLVHMTACRAIANLYYQAAVLFGDRDKLTKSSAHKMSAQHLQG
jgi:hypothetical protein